MNIGSKEGKQVVGRWKETNLRVEYYLDKKQYQKFNILNKDIFRVHAFVKLVSTDQEKAKLTTRYLRVYIGWPLMMNDESLDDNILPVVLCVNPRKNSQWMNLTNCYIREYWNDFQSLC